MNYITQYVPHAYQAHAIILSEKNHNAFQSHYITLL